MEHLSAGTYNPDANFRWMPSIAMDKQGNIAMGYSVSGTALYPSIRFTGRNFLDSIGTMAAESTIVAGQQPDAHQPLGRLRQHVD